MEKANTFYDKTFNKLVMDTNCLNLKNRIYKIPTANIIVED